jgi:hypothetical protein
LVVGTVPSRKNLVDEGGRGSRGMRGSRMGCGRGGRTFPKLLLALGLGATIEKKHIAPIGG